LEPSRFVFRLSSSPARACHRPPSAHPRRHGCAQPDGRHRITRSYGAARRPLRSRQPGPFVGGNRWVLLRSGNGRRDALATRSRL